MAVGSRGTGCARYPSAPFTARPSNGRAWSLARATASRKKSLFHLGHLSAAAEEATTIRTLPAILEPQNARPTGPRPSREAIHYSTADGQEMPPGNENTTQPTKPRRKHITLTHRGSSSLRGRGSLSTGRRAADPAHSLLFVVCTTDTGSGFHPLTFAAKAANLRTVPKRPPQAAKMPAVAQRPALCRPRLTPRAEPDGLIRPPFFHGVATQRQPKSYLTAGLGARNPGREPAALGGSVPCFQGLSRGPRRVRYRRQALHHLSVLFRLPLALPSYVSTDI